MARRYGVFTWDIWPEKHEHSKGEGFGWCQRLIGYGYTHGCEVWHYSLTAVYDCKKEAPHA